MTDTFAEFVDADKDFYLVYGETMAAWAMLERSLADMFGKMIGLPKAKAHAVFFSASSFTGKAALIRAAVEFARTPPPGKAFLTDVTLLASNYSQTRNALAHHNHQAYFKDDGSGRMRIERRIQPHSRRSKGLATAELVNAGTNFRYLSFLIDMSLGFQKLLREPELSGALLALMPADPVTTRIDLNAANPRGAELQRHSG